MGEGARGSLAGDDVGHLLANCPNLRRSGVGRLLDLVGTALSESDGEEADQVVVGSLDGDVGLNQRLPLADKRAKLVGSEVETVEVCQAVLALNLVDTKANLAERMILILLEIGQGHFDDAALEGVVCVLETRCAVD